ncbi:MAG: hypothetical protein O6952_09585, partial [Planctomycetota bacterium]|nr:hypothetical protein [Planctomycetota bacterium]
PLESVAWKAVDLVIHPEAGELPEPKEFSALSEQKRLEALRKAMVFRPGLRVEGRPYGGSPFGLDGKTFEVSADGRIASAKDLGKGIGGLLGGMGGGGEKKGPKSKLERLILEVEITEVGSKGRVHRRALLARGSDEWPLLHASFLIETHPLPEGERDRRALGVLVENREVIEDLLGGEPGEADIHLHSEVSALLLRFSDLRRRILARQVAQEKGDLKFFRERPGLIVETRQLVLDAEGGAVKLRHSIDIMENAVAFVSASGKRAPEAVLRLGVADTALEPLLLVRSDPSDSAPSAWNLLQRARLHGGDRRLEEAEGKLRLAWGADAWWSVDPLTGACVGRVPSGAGQAMVEYAWNVAGKVCDVSMFLGMYTASGKAGGTAKDVDKLVGNMCALHGGTGARDVAGGHIAEIKDALWKHTMSALAGMGGE